MNQHPVFRFDEFVVDQELWQLSRGAQEIHLEPVVLKLLIYLISHRDRLVTRQELMDTVWGDTVISESALSQAVLRLRKALGDDSATPRFVETVHSKGYRFIAEVQEADSSDHAAPDPRQTRRRGELRALFAAAALVIVVVLAVFWTRTPPQDPPLNQEVRLLAVLPLKNLTGDPQHAYFVEGLQDILITELSQVPGLRVTSRQSTRRYRNSDLAMVDIGAELGVDALVEGSLLRKNGDIEITMQLIDARSDAHLWAEQYSIGTSRIFDLIAEIAIAIGAEIRPAGLSPAHAGPATALHEQVDPRAIDAYALGVTNLDRFTRDGISTAINQFETAVAIEPKFALAWGQLAAAHAMYALHGFAPPRESIEKARAASLQAIEADAQFYIGHSTLGWTRLWTGDLEGACKSFREALRLNPSAPYALHGDADCLMLEGRMEENIARTREVLTVGPFSAMHNRILPYHLFLARRYDEAVAAATAMQARVPQFSMHWFFAQVHWQQGRFDEALQAQKRELELRNEPVLLAALEDGFTAGGPAGAMRAMAEALVDRAADTYVDPFQIAETYARAGMVDETLFWLDRAVTYGSYEITYMAFQPEFDALRNESQFLELSERVYGKRSREIIRIADRYRPRE